MNSNAFLTRKDLLCFLVLQLRLARFQVVIVSIFAEADCFCQTLGCLKLYHRA